MRIRTRNIVNRYASFAGGTFSSSFTDCSGNVSTGGAFVPPTGPFPSDYVIERISDSLGKGSAHPVSHRKMHFSANPADRPHAYADLLNGQYGVAVWPSLSSYGQIEQYNGLLPFGVWDETSSSSLPPYWTIDTGALNATSLKEDCLEKARGLKADHLLNLVEGSELWPSIMQLANCLPQMRNNWKALRKLIRTAPGAFLAWKFGVSPVLTDVIATVKHGKKLVQDLKRRANGDSVRVAAKAVIPATFTYPPKEILANGQVIYRTTAQGRLNKPCEVRFVLVVKPAQVFPTAFFNAMDTVLSRFATSPADLAWELIPFSFVVDWFVDLRGMCRAADNIVGFQPYKIVSFTSSFSYEMATDAFIASYSPCPSNGELTNGPLGSVTYKHYERSLVSGGPTWPVLRPRFGKSQAAITAALISQQLNKL